MGANLSSAAFLLHTAVVYQGSITNHDYRGAFNQSGSFILEDEMEINEWTTGDTIIQIKN